MTEREVWARWKHVISIAFQISEQGKRTVLSKTEIARHLESIEHAFGSGTDPLTDLEGYSVATLCRSVRQALEKDGQQ